MKEEVQEDCCIDIVGEMMQKLVRAIQIFERDHTKIYGFTTTQCYTILEIYKLGSLTMNELSDRMNLKCSTMTRILDNLVRDKYIERKKDESDGRIVVVSLTEEGSSAAKKLEMTVKEYYKKIIENIPSEQLEEVLNAVNILQKAFMNANPYCC